MSRIRKLAAFAALVASVAILAAACVESDPEAAVTPTDAETIPNLAPQTDEDGNTVPPEGAELPPAEGEEGGEGGGGGDDAAVADGEAAFVASGCSGCHLENGRAGGGVGPQIAGSGVTEEGIRTIVANGRGAMPPGLASDTDLDNIVAYLLSLQ
ncbi:MAG: cytochrome c [Thermoleophilia bacterium]|nr:cytochrome c [Thermoleophilia bacterium]MDH3725044.1 cytochrome c [Thermoleophilia bacterium]